MNQSREIVGQWWFPSAPGDRWIGTLTLEHGKEPQLKVIIPKGFHQTPEIGPVDALHGHDRAGKPITLLFAGSPHKSGGTAVTEMRFSGGYALVGIEVEN